MSSHLLGSFLLKFFPLKNKYVVYTTKHDKQVIHRQSGRFLNSKYLLFCCVHFHSTRSFSHSQSVNPVDEVHSNAAKATFVSLLTMYAIQTGITCKLQKVYRGHGVQLAIQLLLTVFHFITGIICKLVCLYKTIPHAFILSMDYSTQFLNNIINWQKR